MDLKINQEYLDLLLELSNTFISLTLVLNKKREAAQTGDLMTMNECIKQEQAMSLSLRSIEHRQTTFLSQLGLTDVPLSELPQHYPQEMQMQAKHIVENLHSQYRQYASTSHALKTILEKMLRQIEGKISASQQQKVLLTSEVTAKTDIRA